MGLPAPAAVGQRGPVEGCIPELELVVPLDVELELAPDEEDEDDEDDEEDEVAPDEELEDEVDPDEPEVEDPPEEDEVEEEDEDCPPPLLPPAVPCCCPPPSSLPCVRSVGAAPPHDAVTANQRKVPQSKVRFM